MLRQPFLRVTFGILVVTAVAGNPVSAQDWPMWRGNAQRTASSPVQIGDDLTPLWSHKFSPRKQTWDDPLNLDLMTYDRVFEPIVLDGHVVMGFNDSDKVMAFDANTGDTLWTFFTEAPVRMPPAGWNGKVFFCSDDGFLYCVNVEDGSLLWKFRGGPGSQLALGNQRLTSAWLARGGPVVRDDTVYFAASIWPMMGVFIYALDADTGQVDWVNDSSGAQYIKQPHSAPSFAGVAPQGALVATDEMLIIPGGRSVPAAFNRADGAFRYFEINAGGKGTGGSFVAADDRHFYVHTRLKGTRAFHLHNGVKTAFMPNEPVLANGRVYSAEVDNGVAKVKAFLADETLLWEVEADGTGDLILAGRDLIAAGSGAVTAIRLPDDDAVETPGDVVWSMPVEGDVQRLLAADEKLIAVTLDGGITAFGSSPARSPGSRTLAQTVSPSQGKVTRTAADLLESGPAEGYALWFGADDRELIDAVAAESPFVQLAVVEPDKATVDELRNSLDESGLYGKVTVYHSTAADFRPPKYVAHRIFISGATAMTANDETLSRIYETVRPYGGVMQLLVDSNDGVPVTERMKSLQLEQADVENSDFGVRVTKVGALPGSADWTHQYGDIANTIKSDDARVKLPLGVLWFGGSSNMDVLPRHGHGPPEQVVGGRLFIQGMNSLNCRDVYTGRVMWKRDFDDLGTFDVYYDVTYEDVPLDPKYNQVHIPGANGRGTNYVVTEEAVYILEGPVCHILDAATGELLRDIKIPATDDGLQPEWGYIGVYDDILLGGVGFAMYRDRHNLAFEEDKELKSSRAGFGSKSFDRAASSGLVAFDRHSGEQLWRTDATHSFWHNGVIAGDGTVFCLDKLPEQIEDALRRRGRNAPDTYRIVALDARTGDQQWQIDEGVFGTWLGYSEEHDLLLQAGAAASDRLYGEVGEGMAVYNAADGSLKWKKDALKYAGPCILHNDLIITNANSYTESAGAYNLVTGKQKMVPNPLTGELQPWKVTRAYGCNNIVASENMLTFRSGAAGFCDLLSDSGTGNFGGFKSGCTSNLVVANGVLNAPDYTRTCSCAYQNQTSLALVHMPDIDIWTVNGSAAVESELKEIQQVGINFGAPGDRRDPDGLLWLEYPAVAGDSPPVGIDVNADATFFRRHTSSVTDGPLPWVRASGIEGITEMRIGTRLKNDVSLKTGLPVADANDDAEEDERGKVDLSSSDLELIRDDSNQLVGIRFTDVMLAGNAKIASAHLQFTVDETSADPTSLLVSIQDAANAAPFTKDDHDLSSRSLVKQQVAWTPLPWPREGEAGENQRTPDLAPLLRHVINRPDWKPGNAIAFLISGTGKRVADASRGQAAGAPRLFVDADELRKASDSSTPQVAHRVRLFFPPVDSPRVFDIQLQGKTVRADFTCGGPGDDEAAMCMFEDVMISDELQIEFVPKTGQPVLSGVEFVRSE